MSLRSNHIEHLAEWHACATFFGGMEHEVSLDYEKVLADFAENGTLPEGWNIWEPFEYNAPETIVEFIENQKSAYLAFHAEVVGAGTYFAQDGTYGPSEGLVIVNAEYWSDADFEQVEAESDWHRPETAKLIADKYDQQWKVLN